MRSKELKQIHRPLRCRMAHLHLGARLPPSVQALALGSRQSFYLLASGPGLPMTWRSAKDARGL